MNNSNNFKVGDQINCFEDIPELQIKKGEQGKVVEIRSSNIRIALLNNPEKTPWISYWEAYKMDTTEFQAGDTLEVVDDQGYPTPGIIQKGDHVKFKKQYKCGKHLEKPMVVFETTKGTINTAFATRFRKVNPFQIGDHVHHITDEKKQGEVIRTSYDGCDQGDPKIYVEFLDIRNSDGWFSPYLYRHSTNITTSTEEKDIMNNSTNITTNTEEKDIMNNSTQESNNFKIGDQVEFIESRPYYNINIGDQGIITDLDSNTSQALVMMDSPQQIPRNCWVPISIIKWKEQEQTKTNGNPFKVGEIIEFNEETPYAGLTKGSRVKVAGLYPRQKGEIPAIYYSEVNDYGRTWQIAYTTRFKKIPQEQPTDNPFQIGDQVEIIEDDQYNHSIKKGDQGKIVNTSSDKDLCSVYFAHAGFTYWIKNSDIKKISQEQPSDINHIIETALNPKHPNYQIAKNTLLKHRTLLTDKLPLEIFKKVAIIFLTHDLQSREFQNPPITFTKIQIEIGPNDNRDYSKSPIPVTVKAHFKRNPLYTVPKTGIIPLDHHVVNEMIRLNLIPNVQPKHKRTNPTAYIEDTSDDSATQVVVYRAVDMPV